MILPLKSQSQSLSMSLMRTSAKSAMSAKSAWHDGYAMKDGAVADGLS
jgi:hypothetical protein